MLNEKQLERFVRLFGNEISNALPVTGYTYRGPRDDVPYTVDISGKPISVCSCRCAVFPPTMGT
jgi:hypothetical protein